MFALFLGVDVVAIHFPVLKCKKCSKQGCHSRDCSGWILWDIFAWFAVKTFIMVAKRVSEDEKEEEGSPAAKVSRRSEREQSSFEKGTTEAEWHPDDAEDRVYILRFLHGDTCCDSPYADVEDWPNLSYTQRADSDDDEDRAISLAVIGGVWLKSDGRFVAFWGADDGDSHVDFYCAKDYEHVEDLNPLSGILCEEICPPMIDVFDDGSGKDREPVLLDRSVLDHDVLSNLYK